MPSLRMTWWRPFEHSKHEECRTAAVCLSELEQEIELVCLHEGVLELPHTWRESVSTVADTATLGHLHENSIAREQLREISRRHHDLLTAENAPAIESEARAALEIARANRPRVDRRRSEDVPPFDRLVSELKVASRPDLIELLQRLKDEARTQYVRYGPVDEEEKVRVRATQKDVNFAAARGLRELYEISEKGITDIGRFEAALHAHLGIAIAKRSYVDDRTSQVEADWDRTVDAHRAAVESRLADAVTQWEDIVAKRPPTANAMVIAQQFLDHCVVRTVGLGWATSMNVPLNLLRTVAERDVDLADIMWFDHSDSYTWGAIRYLTSGDDWLHGGWIIRSRELPGSEKSASFYGDDHLTSTVIDAGLPAVPPARAGTGWEKFASALQREFGDQFDVRQFPIIDRVAPRDGASERRLERLLSRHGWRAHTHEGVRRFFPQDNVVRCRVVLPQERASLPPELSAIATFWTKRIEDEQHFKHPEDWPWFSFEFRYAGQSFEMSRPSGSSRYDFLVQARLRELGVTSLKLHRGIDD